MFHNAALRLSLWYLAIIMALSIGCSLAIYHFAAREIGSNSGSQIYLLNNNLAPSVYDNFISLRDRQADNSRKHLQADLIFFNLTVLVAGGIVSYLLARQTMEPIEEALEAQKRFAADASHELRTPLTALQAELEVALRDPKMTKAGALTQLQSNLEEVNKLKGLSESLLKLADQDQAVRLSHTASLKDAAAAAMERLAKAARSKQIKLESNLKDTAVPGDQDNLTDLAAILLDNAIKYSPRGSRITVATGRRAKQAFISVADHGQGISPTDLPHIFDRFYRADTSRTKNTADGYGLGLALARKIVELHGGHIEVESTPGLGSIFSVYLPPA